MVRQHDVVAAKRGAGPRSDRLLPDARMDAAEDLAGPDQVHGALLEPADQPHRPVKVLGPRRFSVRPDGDGHVGLPQGCERTSVDQGSATTARATVTVAPAPD